ncbi:MAG: PEP-CTERM sorting domain-containing protein [Verrucomicrobiota bacterium]|nr:PEP-CTERM sorting domain-containing protein [Verrucomicrobiota bacterium]
MNKSLLSVISTMAVFTATLDAADRFWRASNDGTTGDSYLDGTKYDGVAPLSGERVVLTGNDVSDTTVIYLDQAAPSSSNLEMRDRGATFEVRTGGSLAAPVTTYVNTSNQGNFKLAVKGGSLSIQDFNLSGAGSTRFSVEVTSGSLLFTGSTALDGVSLKDGASMALSGGVTNLGVTSGAIGDFRLANGSANGNLNWTGGTLRGVNRFQGDDLTNMTVTNGGGILYVNNNIRTDDKASYNNGTGTIVFAIEAAGNTNAQLSQFTNGGVWNLSAGMVAVDFGAHTPIVGNSWDFTTLTAGPTGFLASTSNVSSLSADNQWNVTWNTSQWVSSGILSIDGVTAVPEPANVALILAGLTFGLASYRRMRR